MKKYLVLYYSKTGNSKFFAEKTAQRLNADIKPIKPAINFLFTLVMVSTLKLGIKTNITRQELEGYDEVIIWGPIWSGALIAPLRNVIKRCAKEGKSIHFFLTCETSEAMKSDNYGYEKVLSEARRVGGNMIKTTAAFSLSPVNEDETSWPTKLSENSKINEKQFEVFFKYRFYELMNTILMTSTDS